jgi:hypothetical protein
MYARSKQLTGRGRLVILTLMPLLLLLLRLGSGAQAAGHPNFTGNWSVDAKTSDFGPMGAPDKALMNVTHKEPEVTIHSELVMGGTPRTWDATCKTDGTECKSTNGEVTLSVTWQGDTLILNRSLSFSGMAVKVKEAWSLSADGKTLTSTRTLMTDQGNADQKIVFTKP